MLRNVTITLREEAVKWAKLEAARLEMSLSRFVGRLLDEHMMGNREYEEAMGEYLSHPPRRLTKPSTKYPSREEVHDRAGLRR